MRRMTWRRRHEDRLYRNDVPELIGAPLRVGGPRDDGRTGGGIASLDVQDQAVHPTANEHRAVWCRNDIPELVFVRLRFGGVGDDLGTGGAIAATDIEDKSV